jgi:phosphoenolpyruvate carboxykinase (ATP)
VPGEILHPRDTWADKDSFEKTARELAKLFAENFKKYEDQAAPAVVAAGPKV